MAVPAQGHGSRSRWVCGGLAAVLLLMMLGLALGSALRESPTVDEVAHVPAGITYWRQRDLRLNVEHPPLLKMLAAMPLVAAGVRVDDPEDWQQGASDYWSQFRLGAKFFTQPGAAPQRLITLARVPMILMLLAGGLALFHLGRRLGGDVGGLISLSLYATAPFFLGYGPLVHTDVGVAIFSMLALWTFGRLWERPSRGRTLAFGVVLAAALLSKFSAGLLLPAVVVAGLALSRRGGETRRAWGAAARGVLVAGALVYGVYLAAGWNTPVMRAFAATSPALQARIAARVGWLEQGLEAHPVAGHLLTPVLLYARGVAEVLYQGARPAFLLGRHYATGQWFYFPVVFVFKMTPGFLSVLVLLPVVLLVAMRGPGWTQYSQRVRSCRGPLTAVVCGLLVFTAACLASGLNIGIRHFSVSILLLLLLASLLAPAVGALAGRWRWVAGAAVAAAMAGSAVSASRAYPDYISYFNGLIGSRPNYTVAADSNLDWGQGLMVLRKFLDARQARAVRVDMVGQLTQRYLVGASRFDCSAHSAGVTGWAAVSADEMDAAPGPGCEWMLAYPHWELGGGSVLVFDLGGASGRAGGG